jgi:glycosyltransferase involved in cell wall biosynthesis
MITSKKDNGLRVLVLEPYYGGSHKSFLSGLRNLPFQFEFITLPARKWKWRMRMAAPFFAQKLHETGREYDRILCSTYVDVASFRGLAPQWVRTVPLLTYFHENQFAYPMQVEDERDFHFALTNVTTAISSDSLAFNSSYNLTSFLEGLEQLMKLSPDIKLDNPCERILAKSRVLPPGIDFSSIDESASCDPDSSPVIVWNHRWEHDKGPDRFFRTLFRLDREGLNFSLVVLGETFTSHPPIFDMAFEKLSQRILHFGYARSSHEYARWLKRGTTVVSTSLHEFFGIAVIEAVRAGCRPLLPRRLSYPEIFPEEFLYDEEDFERRLREEIMEGRRLTEDQARELTTPFSWRTITPAYTLWIRDGS